MWIRYKFVRVCVVELSASMAALSASATDLCEKLTAYISKRSIWNFVSVIFRTSKFFLLII